MPQPLLSWFPTERPEVLAPLFGVLMLLSLAACDNELVPLTDDPDTVFGVYGFLDSDADTQFVRISALRSTILDLNETGSIDAVVEITNLSTGAQTVWRDSLVTLDDGSQDHLFYAPMRVVPGQRYRLEVRRSDGKSTIAEVTMPDIPQLDVRAIIADPSDTTDWRQSVVLENLFEAPERVSVRYRVGRPMDVPDTLSIRYEDNQIREIRSGWLVEVLYQRDRRSILRQLSRGLTDSTVVFYGLELEVRLPSPEWEATFGINIEGGLGFFGAVTNALIPWELTPEEIKLIGFSSAGS